jgi:hypothetical protein
MEMKTHTCHGSPNEAKIAVNLAGVCRACGKRVLVQINRLKEAILTESSAAIEAHQHALRLALNEAEALAWQTLYPHLVFPTLAAEKVRAVATWNARQQRIREANQAFALAA